MTEERMLKVFQALANEHRLKIFVGLCRGVLGSCCDRIEWFEKGRSVGDVVQATGLSQPTISHHLSILADAGLIRSEKRGLWTCYFPNPEVLDDIGLFVEDMKNNCCCAPPAPKTVPVQLIE